MENTTVHDVINAIEKKGNFYFTYNLNQVNVNRKVSIKVENKTINQILDRLFSKSGIDYKIENRHIVLYKQATPEVEAVKQQKSINGIVADELAIEAPFFGKNVQSMLKLGRAQGVAMAAALSRDIPITEYAPLKIKMAITGNGQASKEQVADMLKRMLHIPESDMLPFMDATDGLAAAYCHYLQMGRPTLTKEYSGWKDFINKNPDKIKR